MLDEKNTEKKSENSRQIGDLDKTKKGANQDKREICDKKNAQPTAFTCESKQEKRGIFAKIKNSELYQKVKAVKNIEIIISLIVIAVALLIYSNFAFKGNKTPTAGGGGITSGNSNVTSSSTEDKLADILGKIDGAGAVDVMIYSTKNKNDKNESTTELITGVIIVAEGADNIRVRMELIQATITLLNISSDKIEIFKASATSRPPNK